MRRLAEFQAACDEAQRECRNKIGDIWGADDFEAQDETTVGDTSSYGVSADGYEQMAYSGDAPFGHPSMWESDSWLVRGQMIVDGAGRSVTGLLESGGTLVGLGGSGKFKAAWSGLGQLGLDLSPMRAFYTPEEQAAANQRLLGVAKGIISYDDWDTSPFQAAGGVGFDVITGIGTGGTAAAVRGSSRVLGATRFASPLRTGGRVDIAAVRTSIRDAGGRAWANAGGRLQMIADGDWWRFPQITLTPVPVRLLGDPAGAIRREDPLGRAAHQRDGGQASGGHGSSAPEVGPGKNDGVSTTTQGGPPDGALSPVGPGAYDDIRTIPHPKGSDEWAQEVHRLHPEISVEGARGIHYYTTDKGYTAINTSLRSGMIPDAVERAAAALDQGLAELPPAPGVTYRGTHIPPHILDQYQPGNVVSDPAFTSSSTSLAEARKFLYKGGGNAEITIHGRSGRDIAPFSEFETESEILFGRDREFRVLSRVLHPDGHYQFIVEEV